MNKKSCLLVSLFLFINLFHISCSQSTGAIVQVYRGDISGLSGFAVHTWLATKKKNEDSYTIYEVLSLPQSQDGSFVRIEKQNIPNKSSSGNKSEILVSLKGDLIESIIDKIHQAAITYPYADEYEIFGPNSNTFIAWIACKVPELNLTLPEQAIGKNYIINCED